MDDDRSPKFFAVHVETGSKFIAACDVVLVAILFINTIGCIVNGTAWLNFAIAAVTLCVAIGAVICFVIALNNKESVYLIPPIVFQTIMLAWSLTLVLAGIFSVTSGHLWSLQSFLGIKPPEIKISTDIRDENYHSADETSPETSRAIIWGEITIILAMALIVLKAWSFMILKGTYHYYLQYDIYERLNYQGKYAEVPQREYDDKYPEEYYDDTEF